MQNTVSRHDRDKVRLSTSAPASASRIEHWKFDRARTSSRNISGSTSPSPSPVTLPPLQGLLSELVEISSQSQHVRMRRLVALDVDADLRSEEPFFQNRHEPT